MKNPKNVKRGKKSKVAGSAFEKVVRKDLESKGWIVDKWSNNVEFETDFKEISICKGYDKHTGIEINGIKTGYHMEPGYVINGKLIPAKNKFRGKNIPMMLGSGFPDFVAFKKHTIRELIQNSYVIIGVESKMTGVLKKLEKEKCRWLLDNGTFNQIFVARKTKVKNRIVVEYEDFVEIEKRMKK